jgi:hypothetical protein
LSGAIGRTNVIDSDTNTVISEQAAYQVGGMSAGRWQRDADEVLADAPGDAAGQHRATALD